MQALLVHGMGRTPASQIILARRLRKHGISTHLFGYTTAASHSRTLERLLTRIASLPQDQNLFLIGHSLGGVLIREVTQSLPQERKPKGCFLLASPAVACKAARFFRGNPLYRFINREMGALLASDEFMSTLPIPECHISLFAGTGGPTGRFSPFGNAPNDGLIEVAETKFGEIPVTELPELHTFIMNSRQLADELTSTIQQLSTTVR